MRNVFENSEPEKPQNERGADACAIVLEILQEHGMSEGEAWDIIRGMQDKGVAVMVTAQSIAVANGNQAG